MSAATAMKVDEIAMGIPYTNMWRCSEADRLEYMQEFYLVLKTCIINGISSWSPKRVFVIVPSSDDRLCTEMSRAALSNKSCDIPYTDMVIGKNISCAKGAKERVRELAELRADSNDDIATGRKIVVSTVERSPPRARGERREFMTSVSTARPKVNTAMFSAIQK